MVAEVAKNGPYADPKQIFTANNDISTVQGDLAASLSKDLKEGVDENSGATVPGTGKANPRFTKQIQGKETYWYCIPSVQNSRVPKRIPIPHKVMSKMNDPVLM